MSTRGTSGLSKLVFDVEPLGKRAGDPKCGGVRQSLQISAARDNIRASDSRVVAALKVRPAFGRENLGRENRTEDS
jgi:hypothetical protein